MLTVIALDLGELVARSFHTHGARAGEEHARLTYKLEVSA